MRELVCAGVGVDGNTFTMCLNHIRNSRFDSGTPAPRSRVALFGALTVAAMASRRHCEDLLMAGRIISGDVDARPEMWYNVNVWTNSERVCRALTRPPRPFREGRWPTTRLR